MGKDNPRTWWQQQAVQEPTWTDPSGGPLTPSTPLTPFRKSPRNPGHDTFWTSNDCRDWKVFGYTYLGKRILPGPSGQNEIKTFPIDLEHSNKEELITYCGQFYAWMDHSGMETHQPTPALIKQFYPIDLSTVEALTGTPSSERPSLYRAHPSRTPYSPRPDPLKPDYSHLHGLITKDCRLRQWDVLIHAEKYPQSLLPLLSTNNIMEIF
jgi:hypothetical protein